MLDRSGQRPNRQTTTRVVDGQVPPRTQCDESSHGLHLSRVMGYREPRSFGRGFLLVEPVIAFGGSVTGHDARPDIVTLTVDRIARNAVVSAPTPEPSPPGTGATAAQLDRTD